MLRQSTTENKATKAHDSVTGPDGRVYHRATYEDEARPGYSRVGRLFSSFELMACGRWGLISPSGHLFSAHLPVPLTPDPSRVSSAEAPEALRMAVAEAEKNLKAAEAKVTAALNARAAAEEKQAAAARADDRRRYDAAVRAAQQAEEQRKDGELALAPRRAELSRVSEKVRAWAWDEHLRRQGRAEEPTPATF